MQISDEAHDAALAALRRAAVMISSGPGADYAGFLVVAHAWALTELAQIVGAKEAARCASNAARRMEALLTPAGVDPAPRGGGRRVQ